MNSISNTIILNIFFTRVDFYMTNHLQLITLRGLAINPYLSSVAKLEIDIFREYPYLYEENLVNQINYVKRYAECVNSIMVLVLDGNDIVGVSTGIPLSFDTEKFKKTFVDNGVDIQQVYYLGESLLLPAYRGKKIYHDFFEKRETAAMECGCTISAFISVERPLDDPRRPVDYVPLDMVWHLLGMKNILNYVLILNGRMWVRKNLPKKD